MSIKDKQKMKENGDDKIKKGENLSGSEEEMATLKVIASRLNIVGWIIVVIGAIGIYNKNISVALISLFIAFVLIVFREEIAKFI